MSRYIARRYADKKDVNPEVLRKAKHLLEVYGEIHKPLILTATCRVYISTGHGYLGWDYCNEQVYRRVVRFVGDINPNAIINTIICTALSGRTFDQGKLSYWIKHVREYNYNHVSTCDNRYEKDILWDCPYCEEIYDTNGYINPEKVFNDIPTRRRYGNDEATTVRDPMDKEILYPIYINNKKSNDLKYIVKRSQACVSGNERMFPFLCENNPWEFRFSGFRHLNANVVFQYSTYRYQ